MVIWIAFFAGVIALALYFSWWMLLALILPVLWLPRLLRRARILQILASEYQYEFSPTAPQAYTLNQMTRSPETSGQSPEEVATYFMTVMVNSLLTSSPDQREFAEKALLNARRLKMGGVISSELLSMMLEVVQNSQTKPVEKSSLELC